MEWPILLAITIVFIFALMIPGVWIGVSLGMGGIFLLTISGNTASLSTLGNITWNTGNDFILSAIPLFLFMGDVVLVSGLSANFYRAVMKWFKYIPGGLLHSNIIACAIFSAISGSSVATAAGIGSVSIPEMKARGYAKKAIYGSLAAGGTLGILIPPSLVLILYGSLVDQSIATLFMAAFVPGVLLACCFLLYTLAISIFNKNSVQKNISAIDRADISYAEAAKGLLPMIFLIIVMLGSLYAGIATPTEAAALGGAIAIFIGKWLGDLNFRKIIEAATSAIKTTTMILFIMIGAQIFTFSLVKTGINRELTSWVAGMGLDPVWLIVVTAILYLILGCFMDGGSMILLTLPLLFPIIMQAGIDPIWLGVFIIIYVEVGQITPPLGVNLFVIQSIDPESKFGEIVQGSFPYLLIMIAFSVILYLFPEMTAWLPSMMMR